MTVLNVTDPYVSGDNVTADNLNKLVNDAEFTLDATDNSTLEVHSAGYLKVKDDGIQAQHLKSDPNDANDVQRAVTTNHIRNENVTTAKIADDNVTFAKIEEMPARTVIGNNTDATANPTAVPIDDLKDSISNATPHTSDTNSDGINDTGGADGLMSAEDKTKLDDFASGATATSSTDGLMSSTDKTKLDAIPSIQAKCLVKMTGNGTQAGETISIQSSTNTNITSITQGALTGSLVVTFTNAVSNPLVQVNNMHKTGQRYLFSMQDSSNNYSDTASFDITDVKKLTIAHYKYYGTEGHVYTTNTDWFNIIVY